MPRARHQPGRLVAARRPGGSLSPSPVRPAAAPVNGQRPSRPPGPVDSRAVPAGARHPGHVDAADADHLRVAAGGDEATEVTVSADPSRVTRPDTHYAQSWPDGRSRRDRPQVIVRDRSRTGPEERRRVRPWARGVRHGSRRPLRAGSVS